MQLLKYFIDKLSDHLRQGNKLEEVIKEFQENYNLLPCIGVEIEFYLSENINIEQFESLLGMKIKEEKGNNQYEIDLPPSTNIIHYIEEINTIKKKIENIARNLQGNVNLRAKPFANDYGNSMHLHMNFIEMSKGYYRLAEGNINTIDINKIAQNVCHYMLPTFLIFNTYEEDYLRFDKNFMTPINVSFGNNNRSVAVRIPDFLPRRIEHRIANPYTNTYIAVFTILNSILLGLKLPDQVNNIEKIYGNAFNDQYNLPLLPKSVQEALGLFSLEFFIGARQEDRASIESFLEIMKKLEC